jgi:5-methylcytosine-specific restriction endonuclease McrA
MLDSQVLVLNQNYQPLNVCNARRALLLVMRGKAEIIEETRLVVSSTMQRFILPSVIRLMRHIRKPMPRPRPTRDGIFARDGWRCVYCGKHTPELTLDHVVPRRRGGKQTWDNLVCACRACNHRKAGRTPEEAGMRLGEYPAEPRSSPYEPFYRYLNRQESWRKFVPGWDALPMAAGQ